VPGNGIVLFGRMGLERRAASSASAGDEGTEKKAVGDEIEDSGV